MALFDPAEHQSCHHYATQSNSGWVLVNSSGQKLYKGETKFHSILFCMEGSARLTVKDDLYELQVGQMKFIPRGSYTEAILSPEGMLIAVYFDLVDFICDKLSLQQLGNIKERIDYNPDPIEIRGAIHPLLDTIKVYLKDNAQCAYLHELKAKELFWDLRSYYDREELAAFLWPIVGVSKFYNDVINAFTCNTKVSELAKRVYMSSSSFYKQFREEFGTSPEQWTRMQSNKQILFLIQDSDLSIGEVASKLSFSSPSSFSRYCTDNFGLSPTALRQALLDGASSEDLLQGSSED